MCWQEILKTWKLFKNTPNKYSINELGVRYKAHYLILLVPCKESSYRIEETAYESDSIITTHMHRHFKAAYNFSTPEDKATYTVFASFKTTDVNFSEEVKMSNVSDFVSSIGGNLGLFLNYQLLGATHYQTVMQR